MAASGGDSLTLQYLSKIGVADWSSESQAAVSSRAAAPQASGSPKASKAAASSPEAAAGASKKKGASPKAHAKAAAAAKGGEAAAAAAAAPAGPPPEEKSKEELAKMTKEERAAYHAARRAALSATAAPKAKQMSKAERRAMQEAQRKVKDDKKLAGADNAELLAELKLQGLTEEQAKEIIAQMASGEVDDAAEESEDEPMDLLASVKEWMKEQGSAVATKATLSDFNLKVRFQGHVDTTPPDHLGCLLKIIASEACGSCDLKAPKLQPTVVTKKMDPPLKRWKCMIDSLYGKIDDVLESVDVIINSLRLGIASLDAPESAKDCALIGCLMALRDNTEVIEDEDLLTGCKRLDPMTKVMEKFIVFLEEELEDSEDGSDDDEE